MSLIVFEGFDHYNSPTTDMLQRSGVLQWTGNDNNASFTTGRNGYGKAIYLANSNLSGVLTQNFSTFYLGFAGLMQVSGQAYVSICDASSGSFIPQYTVFFIQSTGTIVVYRGAQNTGTVVYQTSPGVFTGTNWNYYEIGGVLSATVGTVIVRINGVTLISLPAFNNITTSNAYMNGIYVGVPGNVQNFTLDDMYVCDNTTGPGTYPCNTFLGDVSVDTVFPAANGSVTWTPLANTNWQEVSEVAMDSDTTYNYTTTTGNVDTFTIGPLRTDATQVYGVQVTGAYRKDDAGAHTVAQRIVASGTVENGSTISIPTTYQYQTDLFVLDPATSASWTPSQVNAISIGYDLVS